MSVLTDFVSQEYIISLSLSCKKKKIKTVQQFYSASTASLDCKRDIYVFFQCKVFITCGDSSFSARPLNQLIDFNFFPWSTEHVDLKNRYASNEKNPLKFSLKVNCLKKGWKQNFFKWFQRSPKMDWSRTVNKVNDRKYFMARYHIVTLTLPWAIGIF